MTHFLLSKEYYDDLSSSVRSIVRRLGAYVVGDEKLFYYSG